MKASVKIQCFLLCVFTFCGLSSCSDDTPSHASQRGEKVSSTVLAYMVAQNNLTSSLEKNISDMMKGMQNAPEGSNWLVYIDSNTSPSLYQLKKNANGIITRETIRTYPDQYSTNANTMADVINYAFDRFPAENYGIIYSSHADGWFPSYNLAPSLFAFGQEETQEGTFYMDITDMADALTHVDHLKFVLFDACLMGGVEVAYELRQVSDYFIASPASVLSTGFPYKSIVPSLLSMTESSFTTVVSQYNAEYQYAIGTLSLVRLSQMENVAKTFREMMQLEATQERANHLTRTNKQNFEPAYPSYDFGQLVDSLGMSNDTCLNKIKTALNKAIPYKVHSKYAYMDSWGVLSNEILFYSGLTAYIPPTNPYSEQRYRNFYKKLDWYEASGWNLNNRFK